MNKNENSSGRGIKAKIKEVAKIALISPNAEFFIKAQEELEKFITPEFLEKVRTEMMRKQKPKTSQTGLAH